MVKEESRLRLLTSAIFTLTLSILGSSVLPVPFAFSRMGVLLGVLTMAAVAYSNSLTSVLLLRAAGLTGHDSYEGVAQAVGGRVWKVVTQVSLILLLFGTVIGDFALLADVGQRALRRLTPSAPELLVGYDGRGIMVLLTLCVVLPLCLLRKMRSLETAAQAGVLIVMALAGIIVTEAAQYGFPAIRNGELPLWGIQPNADLPEAFAVLGFAFYVQPMLMPLLHELPPGPSSVNITCQAVRIVVGIIASAVYGVIGIFGAARYGAKTEGNVLVNEWLGGPAEGFLDLAIAAYLSISVPPMQMSCRYTLDVLLAGEDAPFSSYRHTMETLFIVFSSLAVALAFPTGAEKIFAVTGATAVCIVCYVIPVALHLKIYYSPGGYTQPQRLEAHGLHQALLQNGIEGIREEKLAGPSSSEERCRGEVGPTLPEAGSSSVAGEEGVRRGMGGWREVGQEVVLPVLVAVLGVGFSVAALWVSLSTALWPKPND
ncbi:g2035 [Coccomyxa elongata]